jgi:hypothetical protein
VEPPISVNDPIRRRRCHARRPRGVLHIPEGRPFLGPFEDRAPEVVHSNISEGRTHEIVHASLRTVNGVPNPPVPLQRRESKPVPT